MLLSEECEFETWLSGPPLEAFTLGRSGKDKEDLLDLQNAIDVPRFGIDRRSTISLPHSIRPLNAIR